ncbi:hypothetical protein MASR2M117_18000 [Paludibacter sp.]
MKVIFLTLIFALTFQSIYSQNSDSRGAAKDSIDTTQDAFSKISRKSNPQSGEVKFHQDKRIEQQLTENFSTSAAFVNGFRVQVFSSNAHSFAKDQAFKLEQMLNETFPEYKVYVTYSSPFWKVRVGDFLTQQEARVFSDELTRKLPNLKKETYTVKDRVVVSDKKD